MWHDPGLWIVLGVSALFIAVGVVLHRVFVRVLKGPEGGRVAPSPEDKAES
ncbi:hypothetical protein CLU88_2561 [Acidovorax sp. 56]|jgi:hypothetical protein|uniref:cytochrome c biogenesis protein ResB n=1 Tax=Acidovorax sp. 56 TaxID=2035205 RepID=UPI000C544CE1|nr:cytochrome c biogenesis protein ResB [Acidovorax sp. 56]PIF27662.1 hypothetical protein CLU88_2561 [Acidovorax sp. 56]